MHLESADRAAHAEARAVALCEQLSAAEAAATAAQETHSKVRGRSSSSSSSSSSSALTTMTMPLCANFSAWNSVKLKKSIRVFVWRVREAGGGLLGEHGHGPSAPRQAGRRPRGGGKRSSRNGKRSSTPPWARCEGGSLWGGRMFGQLK
jgi:hypothetical protein